MKYVTAKENVKKYQQTTYLDLNDVLPKGCKYEGVPVTSLLKVNPQKILMLHDRRVLLFTSDVINAAEANEYANNVGREFYE